MLLQGVTPVDNLPDNGEPWDGNPVASKEKSCAAVETEWKALRLVGDEATVRSHAKDKHERLAEMTSPVYAMAA